VKKNVLQKSNPTGDREDNTQSNMTKNKAQEEPGGKKKKLRESCRTEQGTVSHKLERTRNTVPIGGRLEWKGQIMEKEKKLFPRETTGEGGGLDEYQR